MSNLITIFLYIISFSISLLYSVNEGWYSSTIFWVFFSILGVVTSKVIIKTDNNITSKLFINAYSIYSILMFITNYLYVQNPSNSFFIIVDSIKFWNYSNFNMSEFNDFITVFNNQYYYIQEFPVYFFINLSTSFISQIFDVNNILAHKVVNVFIGAISTPYLYLILKKYFNKSKSYKYTTYYLLFSFTCIYSIVFFRDSLVTLLYIIGIYYLVYYNTKRYILLKLFVIFIILVGLRLEHAFFFLSFIFGFLYLKAQKNKGILLVCLISLPLLSFIVLPKIFSTYNSSEGTYINTINSEDSSSAGSIFSKAPPGVRNVLMGINSQIAPAVPIWRSIQPSKNSDHKFKNVKGYYNNFRILEGTAGLFSLAMWFILFFSYLKNKKSIKSLPIEVKVLFGLAILLLLTATTVINVRRIYCVYPIIFLVAMIIYNKISMKSRKSIMLNVITLLIFIQILTLIF